MDALERAETLFKEKGYGEAALAYSLAERTLEDPDIKARCKFQIGNCLILQKKPGDAFSAWQSLRHYYPDSTHAPESLSLEANWYRAGNQRSMLEDQIVRLYPKSPQATKILWRRAGEAFQAEEYGLCVSLLEQYLAIPGVKNQQKALELLAATRQVRPGNSDGVAALRLRRLSEEADAFFQQKHFPAALKLYQSLLNDATEESARLQPQVRAAQCLAVLGQSDRAVSLLQKNMSPAAIREFVFLSEKFSSLHPLAERVTKSLLTRFPDSRDSQLTLLKIAAFKAHRDKDYPAGIKYYRDFLRRYPDSEFRASALYQLAAACYYSEDLKAAEDAFRQALDAGPSEALRSEIEKFSNVLKRANEASDYLAALPAEERDFFNASRLAIQNRHSDAAGILSRLVANDQFRRSAKYPEACFRLGECREKLGQTSSALNAYQQCVQAEPTGELALSAILRSGKIHLLRNNLSRAADTAAQLASRQPLPPGSFDFFWRVGIFLLAEGNLEGALPWIHQCAQDEAPREIRENATRIRRMLAEQPRDQAPVHELAAETATRIAEDLLTQQQFPLAELLLRRILAKWPSRQSDYVNCLLGRAFLKQEKVDEAQAVFEVVLTRHRASPHAAEAALRLAIIHTGWRGEPGQGRRYLENVINDYPGSPQRPRALFFLGTLEMWNGNPGPSRAAFEQLVSEYPQSTESSFALVNIEKLKAQYTP